MRTLIACVTNKKRDDLANVLLSLSPGVEIRAVETFQAAETLADSGWDMIFVDLNLPGLSGLTGLITLMNASAGAPVVALAQGHGPEIQRLCRICGLQGMVETGSTDISTDMMYRATSMALRGGLAFPDTMSLVAATNAPPSALTRKQLRVLSEIAEGKSNKQIAKDLELSPNTVKAHVSEVLRRLGVSSRAEAIVTVREPWRIPLTERQEESV